MKNIYYFKSLFRTSLVALCLLTAEVGQMRAGTRRIYFDYSAVSWWKDYTNLNSGAGFAKVHCWGGNSGDQDYTMSALAGQTDLAYCDIDDGWTNICFFRCGSDGTWWTKTHNYDGIGSNNRFKIKNDADNDGIDKYKWADSGAAIRWVPGVSIDGLIDVHNPHNQAFSFSRNDGTYAVTLSAHSTYQFCIRDGSTRYTLDNNVWTSNISNYTLNTSGYDIRLTTAGAGTYTFTYNKSTHVISVAYPTVSHPNIDYCYMYGYTDWDHKYLHVWNSSSSIAGTTWPGTEMFNYVTISDEKYYYYAPGDYANSKPNDNSGNQTDDLTNSQGYSKYMKHNGSTWVWNTFTVRIQLENEDATSAGTEYQDIAFNSGVLSDITCPEKTHYDFQGYYTGDGGTGTQVIDKDGHWIASVAGYTDASKHWIKDGSSNTLYAKWTEHEYAITIAVTGSGSTSPASSTTAKYVTASGDISAIPASGYSFRDWDFSKTGEDNDVYSADGYSSTSNPIHILAQHDGTLTANFTANGYTVTLEDLGADEGHKGTSSVSVTYDATTNLTSSITCPQKAHYDFGGYWTSSNGGSTLTTQLIDDNGAWIADVSGYTSASKQWIYAGDITLYAKWTETAYTITPSVFPAGAGSVNTVTDAHIITASSTITATPANAAWTFDYWEYGEHVGYASGSGNAITVTASQNSTITAHFKPRFSLVGSLYEGDEGGMPGWEDYTKTFAVNSTSPMDLSRTCTLQANSTYKVQVHDNATSTNLGRSGCDPVCVLEENASLVMENSNNDVFLYTSGAGEYIFKITAIDGSNHPTLTVLRPYPVNFGQKYLDIDGTLHIGTTGGTAEATAGGDALTSGDYVTYNTSVTHTATPAGGYTFAGWWSSDAFEGDAFTNNNPWYNYVTSTDNAYAKFVETSTSVTLSNDGHGKVQIGGADATSTTCGVTTTRELTAVPNEGYKFSSWSKSGSDISLTSTSTNPTTLSGNGSGATSGQTVTANFVERYSIKGTMNGENWGTTHTLTNIGTNAGSKDTCYVTMTLPANTTYEFAIYDEQTGNWLKNSTTEVFKMTYGNSSAWPFGTDKTVNCGITTAGKGTYKFIFNITDKTVTVVYPTSYQVNYGASVGGSVTSVVDGDGNAVPNGGYVVAGGSVTYTATAASGYTFVGWCNNDSYGNTFTTYNPWTNSSITATSNAYAKFKSTNFVIYRSGDKDDDPRAALDDVESYGGGTITETIEFRMKVRDLDMWHTLCLPFTVSAVKVWDEVDGPAYYDIVPYYRSSGTFYTGHYIIRTPEKTTDLSIAEFGKWNDPESPTGYKPSKDTPYIIQWHDSYFLGKYISFFGAADQTIPSFSAGSAPSLDNVVNVCVNKSMQTGSVAGAYMLESDYGNGAWLRLDIADESRPIPPFECYLLVNNPTRARYMAIRPGMTAADTPTGWDDVVNSETKTHIVVYSISGVCLTQYSNCSINEAGQRLSESYGEGLYILRADNESVKLMVGGK